MKTPISIITLSLFAFIGLAYTGVSAEPTGAPDKVQATIKRLEEEMTAAALKNDFKKVETYMAKDLVNVTEDGRIQHGGDVFKEMRSGALKLTKAELGPIEVRVMGDTAIAVYTSTAEGSFEGKQFAGKYASMDVFHRIGSDWKIVASQTTKAPPQ